MSVANLFAMIKYNYIHALNTDKYILEKIRIFSIEKNKHKSLSGKLTVLYRV